jgi:hypothetical protein
VFSDTEPEQNPEIAKRIDPFPVIREKVDSLFLFTRGTLNAIRDNGNGQTAEQ